MYDHKTLLWASAVIAGGSVAFWAVRRWRRRAAAASEAAPSGGDHRATSFEAFLRSAPCATPAPAPAAAAAATATAAPRDPPPGARPVTVLYGTEFGLSREVAEKACAAVSAAGGELWPHLVDMAAHPGGLPLLLAGRCQALLVVCSTQGDGVPPSDARPFCDWLSSCAAPALGGLRFSVAALGDTSYAHFARCGRRLDARLEALGAARLAPRVDVNKEDWRAIEGWIRAAVAGLRALPLRTVEELGWGEAEAGAGEAEAEAGGAGSVTEQRWTKARPYCARVVAVEPLCVLRTAGDKNTVRVDLDLGDSGLSYDPGDALGVWPCNVPAAVEALLRAAGLDGGQAVPVPGWHYRDPALPPGAAPLRDVLARAYDLRSPRRGLLALLHSALQDPGRRGGAAAGCRAEAAADDGGRAHADGTGSGHAPALESPDLGQHAKARAPTRAVIHVVADAAPPAPAASPPPAAAALRQLAALVADPQATEAYLRPRHVADVLRDWAPPGALTAGELLIVLRPLAPRLYSISSSPLESPGRVQVTVAVVRYESLGAERLGVCSTWLGERRAAGQSSLVFVSRSPDFRLPPSLGTPLIMVGPGTGVAPFRAFTQHRLLQAASNGGGAPGQTVLFFGSRRRDQDFLYGDALEAWAAGGQLSLFTAFSREAGGPKVYVQQRVREQGSLVWALLQEGAHVYVCGDATRMAGDVDAALLEVVAARLEGGARQGAARAYLDELAAAGRYQRDVWF